MRKTINVYFVVILVATDAAMAFVAYLLAHQVRFYSNWIAVQEMHSMATYTGLALLQAALAPPIFAVQGLYRQKRTPSWTEEFYSVFSATSIVSLVVLAAAAFASRDFPYSRIMLALSWLFCILLVTVGRVIHWRLRVALRSRVANSDRVLIVGTGEIAKMVLDKIRNKPGLGYHAVGFADEQPEATTVYGIPVLGVLDDIGSLIKAHRIDEVIVALPTLSHRQLLDIVSKCQREKVNIKCFPDLFQIMASEVNISDLDGLPLITIKDVALTGWKLAVKRWLDLVGSAATLIALSPLLLFIALLVKLTGLPHPVFYVQERVGLDGKPFQMIKFRSMIPGAEEHSGPVWAVKGDPRTTKLGSFLRRYSLDELPQLINVLAGEMSLVGPRPERPFFVEQFKEKIPRYYERHNEKAGITGWAQVNGLRGNTSIEERTAYDLWYVENWTLWLDIKILLRSVFVVFTDKNAY